MRQGRGVRCSVATLQQRVQCAACSVCSVCTAARAACAQQRVQRDRPWSATTKSTQTTPVITFYFVLNLGSNHHLQSGGLGASTSLFVRHVLAALH